MDTQSTTPLSTESLDEIAKLKARIAELEGKEKKETKRGRPPKAVSAVSASQKEDRPGKVQQDEYISVVSLIPYTLNLSTKEGGQGSVKKFTKFGEVKQILYKDLVDIMEVNSSFMEAGYFYILNKNVIRQHGLDDIYSKILTKEKIEEIIRVDSDNALTLYNSATDQQKEIIVELLIDRAKKDANSLDMNIVSKISKAAKVDILAKADEARDLEKERASAAE